MRSSGILLVTLAFVSLACDKQSPPLGASASVSPLPPVAPSASDAAAAIPSAAAPKKRRPPKSFDQLSGELHRQCAPKRPGTSNVEMKEQAAQTAECLRKKMVVELDKVLLPLRTSQPEKFKALMKQQAGYNRFVEASCWLEEERTWVDFDTGVRDDGTARSYAYIGCLDKAHTERTLYARELAAADTKALRARVDALQLRGADEKTALAGIVGKAQAWERTPPVLDGGSVIVADWKEIVAKGTAVQNGAAELAKNTCTDWPELGTALGGTAKCAAKMEPYYLMQGIDPEAP